MLGAIFGDIAGSAYEFNPCNDYNLPLITGGTNFTDDTVCTIAVADALLHGENDFAPALHAWCRKYPKPVGGYGLAFRKWVMSAKPVPYFSFGNGAAMRVSPIGWFAAKENDCIDLATRSAIVSHNHPEGIRGAQTVAWCVFQAVKGKLSKKDIIDGACKKFGYNLAGLTLGDFRNIFAETCQQTIPAALLCIERSTDFESAVRLAVSLGADADTLGAIVGGIAEPLYGMPHAYKDIVWNFIDEDMKRIVTNFRDKYGK